MPSQNRVIFCKDQQDINHAVQKWVNVEQYKRVYTSSVDAQALHYLKQGEDYTNSPCTPLGEYKHVVIFEK